MFAANTAMILFGLLMERQQRPGRSDWSAFWFGSLIGVVPWVLIVVYLAQPPTVPGFVYAITVVQFVLFFSFAVTMALQYAQVGWWRDYLHGEVTYIVLSLTREVAACLAHLRQRAPHMTWTERLLKWIEPEDNPRNTIYGAIAVGLVVAAENPAAETYPRVVIATVVAVAAYWLAHGYAHWVDERLRRVDDGNDASSLRRLGIALARRVAARPRAAAIPLVALLIAWVAGTPLPTGATAAVGDRGRRPRRLRTRRRAATEAEAAAPAG